MSGHLLIVLGAPALLGDLLSHAFAGEPDVRVVVEPGVPADGRAAAARALAQHPTATVVVLDADGREGVTWRLDSRPLEPVSLPALLAAARHAAQD